VGFIAYSCVTVDKITAEITVRTVCDKADRTQYPILHPQFWPTRYPIRVLFIHRLTLFPVCLNTKQANVTNVIQFTMEHRRRNEYFRDSMNAWRQICQLVVWHVMHHM